MLDTCVAPLLATGERVVYAGSIASQVGQAGTIFGSVMNEARGWVYHVALDNGQDLCFAGRNSLIPLVW